MPKFDTPPYSVNTLIFNIINIDKQKYEKNINFVHQNL